MKKYTHFTENEITGEYYKEPSSPWLLLTIVVSALTVIIIEWGGLADWLLGSLMN